MKELLLFIILLSPNLIFGQPSESELIQDFHWRNIGPANQGGRIVDIEALNQDFSKVWIATGSGGVWHSENAGTTWQPIFENYATASIGDIAVFQKNPEIVWVGTGEANNRNSVSWGDGIYKSMDGGKTFNNMGLSSTHQISRVILHPDNPEIVYVAAIGHLWGYTGERGLFKSEDGGSTWKKLARGLPDDGETGCIDLLMDPSDPEILYTAFYHRLRQPWHFHSGGPNGGIYKSVNGGRSWKKLSNGLPPGETGRIGLAIYRKNPEIVMALVEAKRSTSLDTLGSGIYRTEDGGDSWHYVNTYNNRPFYYSQIRINPVNDQKIYVLTTRFMVSEDGGKTLKNGSPDQEVHGDFHGLWSDPNYEDRYYLGADKGISLTHDGKYFTLLDNLAIGQFYRINYDFRDPYYVYGGLQDNGMYATASFARDARGILSDHNWKLHWGDGQFINIDPGDWRNVYTSMENGSIYRYSAKNYRISRIQPNINTITNYEEAIPDSVKMGGKEFRFNWTSPFIMSPHDPKTLLFAGNYVFMSKDMGTSWRIISPDISTNDPVKSQTGNSGGITPDNTGAEYHCAAYTMSVSPIDPRLIWIGTDDGNVQVTRNGGKTWTNVRSLIPRIPEGLWVSRVEASHHDPRVAYITFDGHRSDHFQPWVFRAESYGLQWRDLKGNLPDGEVIRVVREDPVNHNQLYLGTETGIWASINGGASWFRMMPDFPTVSVYDLKIHPRDHDLIAGTHGRSIWILDDISPLQQLTPEVQQSYAWLFEQLPATIWENTSRGGQRGHFWFAGENPSTFENVGSVPRAAIRNNAQISYYIGITQGNTPILEISDPSGQHLFKTELNKEPGIHRYKWNLEFDTDWLTEKQKSNVETIFQDLINRDNLSALNRAYDQYKNAKTPKKQRAAINILRSGFLNVDLDETYDIPVADPGVYILKMKVGDQEHLRKLVIREDPLNKS